MTADQVKALLGLTPLEPEGGWFAETYRARARVPAAWVGTGGASGDAAATPGPGERPLATAIYYLLTPGTFSALHRLRADEVFHFYLGDPVEMLMLEPDGPGRVVRLGTDLASGMRPQVVVPAGVWQGSRLEPGGAFALLGTTVSPGFDPADFELAARVTVLATHPGHREHILALTR